MFDQAQPESQPDESLLHSAFGMPVDQASEEEPEEKVTQEEEPVQKIPETKETQDLDSEDESEEESEEPEDTDTKPETPDMLDQESQESEPAEEYEVAGTKYKSFSEAQKAVRRISGDNTRMAGEMKRLAQERDQFLQERNHFYTMLQAHGRPQVPARPTEDTDPTDFTPDKINSLVDSRVKEIERQRAEAQHQSIIANDLQALEQEADYEDVYPIFEAVVTSFQQRLGVQGIQRIHPRELYNIARAEYAKQNQTESGAVEPTLNQIAESKAAKAAAKRQAKKVIGGQSSKVQQNKEEEDPLLAAAFG